MKMRVELHVEGVGVVRARGLKVATAKGRRYVYHRASKTRLEGITQAPDGRLIATTAVLDEINRLSAPRSAVAPGSVGALFEAWRASVDYRGLRARTRADYERVMAWLAPTDDDLKALEAKHERMVARAAKAAKAEPKRPTFSTRLRDLPLRNLTPPMVFGIREKAFKAHGRRFANYVVSVLSSACVWAVPRGYVKANPATDIPQVRRPTSMPPANPLWSADERAAALAFFRAKKPHLVLPHLIGALGGLREGDVLRLPVTAWDGVTFRHRASKNGEERELSPPPAALRAALDDALAARKARADKGEVLPMRLCLNSRGEGWSEAGFRASYFGALRDLRAQKKIRPGRTFHSHRHGVGVALAEAGLSEKEIGAYLANRSSASIKTYTAQADRKRMAAAGVAALDEGEQ